MIRKQAIRRLVETSRAVFRSCSLPNGAIVAARPDLPDYPATVQSYGLVWLRDAAFVCVAAHAVGIRDIQEPFFRWVATRAEGIRDGRLPVNAFFPNGAGAGVIVDGVKAEPDRRLLHTLTLAAQVQFDSLGTLLWALGEQKRAVRSLSRTSRDLAVRTAALIVRHWNGRSFTVPHWDLWEACVAESAKRENFAYTLAMCIRGLESADDLLGRNRARSRTIRTMRRSLETLYDARRRTFLRAAGRRVTDATPDMSLLGLIFPSQQIAAEDPRMMTTVPRLLKACRGTLGGFKRYPSDRYSGQIENGRLQHTGGGDWPWLSAWAAIVLSQQERPRDAEREFTRVLKLSRGKPLPEQFHADRSPSVPGLAISHAFAVLAAKQLRLL